MQFPEHLDEGIIHTWLDGQLPPDEAAAVEAHVASCDACAALVAEARGYVAGASRILGALDGVGSGRQEAGSGGAAAAPPVPHVVPIAPRRRARRWMIPSAAAATLLVAIGTTLTMRVGDVGIATRATSMSERAAASVVADSAAERAAANRIAMPATASGAMPVASPSSPSAGPSIGEAGGGAGAGARDAAIGALAAQKTLPPAAPPTPEQALAERAQASAKKTANEQTAVADVARRDELSGRVAGAFSNAPARAPVMAPMAVPPAPEARIRLRGQPTVAQVDSVRARSSVAMMRTTPLVVSGRVTTVNAVPVQSASVLAVGLNLGASSGADGRYVLTIPGGRVAVGDSMRVQTRRIGYQPDMRTVVLPAQGDITLDVALTTATASLNAVVVTGLGSERARAGNVRSTPARDASDAGWVGCYAAERSPAGFPARFQLDTTTLPTMAPRRAVRSAGAAFAGWEAVGRDTVRMTSVTPPTRTWTVARTSTGALTLERQAIRKVACER